MILCDKTIRNYCVPNGTWAEGVQPMLEPFSEAVSGGDVISWGLTTAGYDLRLGCEVLVFKNTYGEVIDPKKFKNEEYLNKVFDKVMVLEHQPILIPAFGYILGRSYEYFRMPSNIKGHVGGKSTFARCGIIINTTAIEPGWHGHLTIEIANTNNSAARVYAMEGIAQVEFHTLDAQPEKDYASKGGKYQNQTGVTPAKVL